MEAVVERFARSPKLGLAYRDLRKLWEREQTARRRVYQNIEDGQKVMDYAAHDVRAYRTLDPDARTAEKYVLNAFGRYALEKKVRGDEEVQSEVVAGFKTPAAAFSDERANLAALRRMLR